MSASIIPNCFHPDGTPCIAYGNQADSAAYYYQGPPPASLSQAVSVAEPATWALLLIALIAWRIQCALTRRTSSRS